MARRRKPRGLTGDEAALWEQVKSTARPLTPPAATAPEEEKPIATAPPKPRIRPKPPEADPLPPPPGPRFEVRRAPDVLPALAPGLDRRTERRLKRGQRPPEDRLDLHGMTAARAHGALARFVRASHARGLRCVLVITGKGGRGRRDPYEAPFMPEDAGVLRHSVPRWLAEAPLRGLVNGVLPAHRRHGGEGALYVYLRRIR